MRRPRFMRFGRRTLMLLIEVLGGVAFYVFLSRFDLVLAVLGSALTLFQPFFAGLALAYVLNPLVSFLERRGIKRAPAVLLVFFTCILAAGGAVAVALPQLVRSFTSLVSGIPFYYSQLQRLLIWAEGRYSFDAAPILNFLNGYVSLLDEGLNLVLMYLPTILKYGQMVGRGLYVLFTGAFLGLYTLLEKDALLRRVRITVTALCGDTLRRRIRHVAETAHQMLGGYIALRIAECLLLGALCALCCVLFDIPYAVLMSLVVGVTHIVPIVGPIIGCLFCCLLLVVFSPVRALLFFVICLLLQVLDYCLIQPRTGVRGGGLKTLWVLVALLLGWSIGGIVGMILGVPVMSILLALASELANLRLREKGIDITGPEGSAQFREAFEAAKADSIEVRFDGSDATITDLWNARELTKQFLSSSEPSAEPGDAPDNRDSDLSD